MISKTILIGNLTRDVDLTTSNNGTQIGKFTLAVRRNFRNADNEYDTDYINIVAYGKLAENCGKFLKKGSKTAIVGRIQTGSYDAKDGTKRYTFDVVADEVEFFLTGSGTIKNETVETNAQPELTEINDDQLPF